MNDLPYGWQEYLHHPPGTDRVFPHGYWFADGYLHPPDVPGLGVDIDEEAAARYPTRESARSGRWRAGGGVDHQ